MWQQAASRWRVFVSLQSPPLIRSLQYQDIKEAEEEYVKQHADSYAVEKNINKR